MLEAAVVARPDPKRDEVPVVFVVPGDDPRHPVTAENLLRLLGGHFARWRLPRPADIHFVTALPKTSVGKLDKKALRRLVADAPPAPRGDAHRAQARHEPEAGEGRS